MEQPKIYIFELEGGTFRGVEAINEDQAFEIAELKGYCIKRLARVENIAITEGDLF